MFLLLVINPTTEANLYLFRIHIRPYGGSASMPDTFSYCLENKLIGVGWRTNSGNNTKDWDEYYNEASSIHVNLNICKYIREWVSEGDLIWTRDVSSQYYIARVTSGWEYWASDSAKIQNIDVANIVRCEFQTVEIDEVPGKVIASFRAPRTFQEVADRGALEYSKFLWNRASGTTAYTVDKSKFPDIFTMLDDEETEDLLFLYLQRLGWFVVPNSRKADKMSFEYLVINPTTGERAQAQVKTGNTSLNRADYAAVTHKVFLFQSNGNYTGDEGDNVICVSREEIEKFLNLSINWLPRIYAKKMGILAM